MNRRLASYALALGALLAGCATREAALVSAPVDAGADRSTPVPPLTDCPAALAAYFAGGAPACDFIGSCGAPVGACCTQNVECAGGLVVGAPLSCEVGCVECHVDRDCPATQLCDGARCLPCPFPPDGSACLPCPVPLERVVRNSCATCDCRPPSQCHGDAECAAGDRCLPGQACDPACPAPDSLACCANACGASSCPFPVPLGCVSACPPEVLCPGPCISTACRCDGMTWTCDRVCAPPGYPVRCAL